MFSNTWLVIRNLFTIIVFPGTVTLYIPFLILGQFNLPGLSDWSASQFLALLLLLTGTCILLGSILAFAVIGKGTLAPFDETNVLVVQGLHRFVRNPMYIGVVSILLAEAWFFGSFSLLLYAGIFFLLVNAQVIFYEENRLEHKFGDEYRDYCKHVGRWIPGRPYGKLETKEDE